MRLKWFLAIMLALAPLAQAHGEEPKSFADELRQLAPPPPPPPPPAEVRPSEDELIAKAKEFAVNEIPIWKNQLRGAAAADRAKSYTWQLPNPTGCDRYLGNHCDLDLKSMDEMRVFWGTYFDILKRNMPGVAITLKYMDAPSYGGEPHGVEITASW
jgi:hypothetical protein